MLLVAITLSSTPDCISPWPHWVTAPQLFKCHGKCVGSTKWSWQEHWPLPVLGFQQGFYFVPLPSAPPYWFLTPTGDTSTGLLTPDVFSSVRHTLRILTGQNQVSTDEWGAHKLIF